MADVTQNEKMTPDGMALYRTVPDSDIEEASIASGIGPAVLDLHYKGTPSHSDHKHGGDPAGGSLDFTVDGA